MITDLDDFDIYTPVDAHSLKQLLTGYADAWFVTDGFINGFSLGVNDCPHLKPCTKKYPAKKLLHDKIQDEVMKGRIIGPIQGDLIKKLMVSPAQVIPKADSAKLRMIFNLSQPVGHSVNDNIKQEAKSVTYCSVTDVVNWIMNHKPKDTWFMAKVDLTDAYRIVPIKKAEWTLLGMQIGEDIYIDRCLPMGAASSCSTFQRISDAITWIALTTSPVHCIIYNYLDDFLLLADGCRECELALAHFEQLCERLRVPLATHKTVRPTTHITFLGLGIDSKDRVVFIPPEKAAKTLQQLNIFLDSKKPKVRDWQSILGKLSHLTHVIPAGRTYLGSVYSSLQGILSQEGHLRRWVSAEVKEDLGIWKDFLKDLPPTRCFRMYDRNSSTISIATDSSTSVGYGGIMKESWFAGTWPCEKWSSLNIALLELYPIYAALHTWTNVLADSTVSIHTDNKALVEIINKLYTKDKTIRQLLKKIALWGLTHNVLLIASHIPGIDNVGPDLLSRGKIPEFLNRFPNMQPVATEIPIGNKPENINLTP